MSGSGRLGTFGVLADLVLPADCAGCGVGGPSSLCPACADVLDQSVPYETVPTPAPYGLPTCVTLAPYDGPMRGLVLAYKDRGRHRLARPLGRHLARVVAAGAVRMGCPTRSPVVLVPVPSTPAAARERHGDHMRRLAAHAVRTLEQAGWPAARSFPAVARPRSDSAHLTAPERAAAARDAFRVRPRAASRLAEAAASGACVIIVDDVMTTGATIASLAIRLADAGVTVAVATTLAATERHPR